MAKCTNCAAELEPGVKFCTVCGTKVEATAPDIAEPAAKPAEKAEPAEKVKEKTTKSEASKPAEKAEPAAAKPAAEAKPQAAKPAEEPVAKQPVAAVQPAPAAPQPVYAPAQPAPAPQPAYPPAQPATGKKARAAKEGVVPTSNFFWNMLLFSIPVLGWLICIITACGATKYDSKRNWARAYLVWFLVGIVIAIILGVLGLIFQNQILALISNAAGYPITSWEELIQLIQYGYGY